MENSSPAKCARCGKPGQPSYRFCPECGLPVSGEAVLSTRIRELRPRGEPTRDPRRWAWTRVLLPSAVAAMLFFVVGVGVVLFNRPLMERLFPPAGPARPKILPMAPRWEPEWVTIAAGRYRTGPPFRRPNLMPAGADADDPKYYINRDGITNQAWLDFLQLDEAGIREAGLWDEAVPRPAPGWTTSNGGLPVPAEELEDELVRGVGIAAVELYRQLEPDRVTPPELMPPMIDPEDPDYYIDHDKITNAAWAEFLHAHAPAIRDAGLWDDAVPDPPRWTVGEDGTPIPPKDEEYRLVAHVGLAAIERYYDWLHTDEVPYEFAISKYEVRNALWLEFLMADEERLVEAGVWDAADPGVNGGWIADETGRSRPPKEELDRPVRHVSAEAARYFCAWLTRRLRRPGWRIRLPLPEEWEYAARGTDWRLYPWGDEFLGTPAPGTGGAGRPRSGIHQNDPLRVSLIEDDESPFGVVAMGSNVAEWVELGPRFEHPVGAVAEIRGGSFRDDETRGRHFALVWSKREVDPQQRFSYTGVRLVRVREPR